MFHMHTHRHSNPIDHTMYIPRSVKHKFYTPYVECRDKSRGCPKHLIRTSLSGVRDLWLVQLGNIPLPTRTWWRRAGKSGGGVSAPCQKGESARLNPSEVSLTLTHHPSPSKPRGKGRRREGEVKKKKKNFMFAIPKAWPLIWWFGTRPPFTHYVKGSYPLIGHSSYFLETPVSQITG